MKFRIRRNPNHWSLYDYVVEEKGWFFWSPIGTTDSPEDFKEIVEKHLNARRDQCIKDSFEPLYADAYWFREHEHHPSEIRFQRTRA